MLIAMGHSSYPRSSVLILGQSCIYSLLPSTLFAQVESLLQNGLLPEAEALLDKAEVGLAQGTSSSGDQTATLRYLHQCVAFAFMRQTRFREATAHFVRGAIDPRVPISYFDELRPSLFGETLDSQNEGKTAIQSTEGKYVDVEVWDGVREYMPKETSIDNLIAVNLVRNYSPYLRPGVIPGSPTGEDLPDATPSTSAAESGTRTHPVTIAMREGLRADANEMVKSILAAVLGSAEVWSREIIEITSTALALLYAHARDIQSLLALFAPPSPSSTLSLRPVSRAGSRPPSRPSSTSQVYPSNGHPSSIPSDTRHVPHPSQTISPIPAEPALPFCSRVLAPALAQQKFWGVLVEMWKVISEGERVIEILVGLVEGKYIDVSVIDPLEQIFAILSPARPDPSSVAFQSDFSLSEHERARLVRKWAAWLAGKDVERGMKLLTSLQPSRPRRATGGAGRGVAVREETQKADELAILSDLRNTNVLAAKRYLEWLVVGRGLGRGGKETGEETELFEELVWSCVQEVLDYVADESVGKLWRAKAASYGSSPSSSTTTFMFPPPPKSPSPPSPTPLSLQPPRSPFLSYFASTTPDSPSKRARIRTILVLESLGEGKQIVRDIQERIISGGWDKTLGLEMAILYSKIPSARTTLGTLHALRDTPTAESYASSSGASGVVCTKVGVSAAEGCGLTEWAGWFTRGATSGGGSEEGDMLRMLLEVYMEDGDPQQTARLLSSQTAKLDVVDITPLVPPSWSLQTLSTYLTRSLRRSQHVAHEGQIVKAICAGQNLAVLESTYEILQDEGAIVEEAVSDEEDEDEGGENEKPEKGGEMGRSFDEKVGLHGSAGEGGVEVADVHVGSVS